MARIEKIDKYYIEYYHDDDGKYTARVCKELSDGTTRTRTVKKEENLRKLIEISTKHNEEKPPRHGVVFKNGEEIIKEFDKYMNKKRRFCVLNPIKLAMKVSRKNVTLKKVVVIGSLITVFAINGLGATKAMPESQAYSASSPAIVEQADDYDIQSDSIEEILDTKTLEEEQTKQQEKEEQADTTVQETTKQSEINQMLQSDTFHFSYENRVGNQSFNNAKRYEAIFDKYAKMYGLDKDLLMAIAAQESYGDHYSHLDSGAAMGIMQIEKSVHIGHTVSAYNFEKGEVETINVTEDNLKDLDTNIKIGAMIQRSYLENNNYNIALSLQTYNMGPGNMNQVLNICSSLENIEVSTMKNDPTNTTWMRYRKQNGHGDSQYAEHVLSYVDASMITVQKRDGSKVRLNLVNDYTNNLNK